MRGWQGGCGGATLSDVWCSIFGLFSFLGSVDAFAKLVGCAVVVGASGGWVVDDS